MAINQEFLHLMFWLMSSFVEVKMGQQSLVIFCTFLICAELSNSLHFTAEVIISIQKYFHSGCIFLLFAEQDPGIYYYLELIYYFIYFSTVIPSNICVFLSCRPFVVNTTFSTGLMGVEVSFVSWLGQLMGWRWKNR